MVMTPEEKKEKARQQARIWRALNPDKVRAARKAWKKNHPEKVKAEKRQWYRDHRLERSLYRKTKVATRKIRKYANLVTGS